mmetsp:Transcript_40527/g.56315  ORF Transcript_40527/g.56315 Transcript_40527/m.56315 type:complete len:234 (+) Transcript_40527:317-1018(+)
MKLFEVFVCFVFFLGLLHRAQTWPCAFTSGNQSYDFTSQSSCTNTSSTTCSSGMYRGVDSGGNEYYFKLCDPVLITPHANVGSECKHNTQNCAEDGNQFDSSYGVGPPLYSLISKRKAEGVVLSAKSGDICSQTQSSKETTLILRCPSVYGRNNYDIDPVEEYTCGVTITVYIDAACSITQPESSLDCCLYQSFYAAKLMGQCTRNGVCPSEKGFSLVSQYSATDCDDCNPIF